MPFDQNMDPTDTGDTGANQYAQQGAIAPDYYFAADSHSSGNGNFAFTNPATWGTGVDHAAKFAIASVASGLNSFYNTGVSAANWFGADAKENDVADQLSALDDDLGNYYRENRQAVDLAGFVVTSLVPGIGGVKLLNAGQKVLNAAAATGKIGGNMGKIVGLLTPKVDRYVSMAGAELAASNAAYNVMGANTLRAIGAGYGQAALESFAFEAAVTATMNKSPVLSEQDGWDLAKNMLTGTVVGGVIGGVISHAGILGKIKSAAKTVMPEEQLFMNAADLSGADAAQRIALRSEHLAAMPEAPTAQELLAPNSPFKATSKLLSDLPQGEQAAMADSFARKFSRLRDETFNSMQNKNRADIHSIIAGGDSELGNYLADSVQGLDEKQMFSNFTNLTEAGRVNSALEKTDKLNAAFKKQQEQEVKKGLRTINDLEPMPYKTAYVKLSGEGAGDIMFDAPKGLTLGDKLGSSAEVDAAVAGYKFQHGAKWDGMADHTIEEYEARRIWADSIGKDGLSRTNPVIDEFDIPLLEQAVLRKFDTLNIRSNIHGNYALTSFNDIVSHLENAKNEVAVKLRQAGTELDDVANAVNVRRSYLNGEVDINNSLKDLLAAQSDREAYAQSLKDKGLYSEEKYNNYFKKPQYLKGAYNTATISDDAGNVLTGMASIKAQQKVYQQSIDAAVGNYIPSELADRFWHPGDSLMATADRFGVGPGLVKFTNAGYHTLGSWAESIGSATNALRNSFKKSSTDMLQSHMLKLASNQEHAIEFESINKFIQSTSELYGLDVKRQGLVPLRQLDWEAKVAKGSKAEAPVLQEGAPMFLPIKNPEVYEAWAARTELTGTRTQAFSDLRNAQGLEDLKDPRALRPIRPDPKDYPYFAIVVDPTISGVGHKSFLHAASEKELGAMINKVPEKFQVYTKNELKGHFEAEGTYDYEMSLHENYIDSSLRSSGVNNPFFQRTDPDLIVQSWLKDHMRSDDLFARELVNAKYEKEFGALRQMGEQYTGAATSKYTGSFRSLESEATNPYNSYTKTALDISRLNEHPMLAGLNNMLDKAASSIYNTIADAGRAAKSPADLDNINTLLNKYGVQSAYRDAATDMLANHSAPKGVLSKFVSRANSMVSTLVTRLDPFNAINNIVGANVLYGTELKSVLRAMDGSGPEIMGPLNGLLKMPAPSASSLAGQPADQLLTANKLVLNAMKNFTNRSAVSDVTGESLLDFYKRNGFISRMTDQWHSMLDDLTLVGNETASTVEGKITSAFKSFKQLAEKGEVYTGNKWAEEFNRFVAADTMRQITDFGVKAGKITPEEQLAYINSFVNRTQGNVLASQRPLMFQGPLGQAVGLFQTFQFNTMQQMFRHVSEGSGKDAAMLLGLQGTLYGMNGLPAFNFLNTHIVGTMSGNPEHRDLYDSTYGIAGKSVGDLILYGLPSNLLRGNLYSRGDINPRQATIIPTNPLDIPFVNAAIHLFDTTKLAVSKVADGGNLWESFLQGMEHNGLSRPLAGISQVLQAATHEGQVFSTTSKGSIAGANDLAHWSSLIRLAGAKPLDEAIANDSAFRISTYQAADNRNKDVLAQALKTTVVGGGQPSLEQVNSFAKQYAELGGRGAQFNKWMMKTMMDANTPQANKIMEALRNPYSQKMQSIMGGVEVQDTRSLMNSLEQPQF